MNARLFRAVAALAVAASAFAFACPALAAKKPAPAKKPDPTLIVAGDPRFASLVRVVAGGPGCAGALVAPDLVLTPAHCVERAFDDPAKAKVYFALDLRNLKTASPATERAVVEIDANALDAGPILRSAPDGLGIADVALLRLDLPAPDGFAPARLDPAAAQKAVKDKAKLYALGYGGPLARVAEALATAGPGGSLRGTLKPAMRAACGIGAGGPVLGLDDKGAPFLVGVNAGGLGCRGFSTIAPLAANSDWLARTAALAGLALVVPPRPDDPGACAKTSMDIVGEPKKQSFAFTLKNDCAAKVACVVRGWTVPQERKIAFALPLAAAPGASGVAKIGGANPHDEEYHVATCSTGG